MARKLSKAAVHYRPGTPAKHCGNCVMYRQDPKRANGHCTLVVGYIEAIKVCDRWAAKEK